MEREISGLHQFVDFLPHKLPQMADVFLVETEGYTRFLVDFRNRPGMPQVKGCNIISNSLIRGLAIPLLDGNST